MKTINLWTFGAAVEVQSSSPQSVDLSATASLPAITFSAVLIPLGKTGDPRVSFDFFFGGWSDEVPSYNWISTSGWGTQSRPPNFLFRASFRFTPAPIVAGTRSKRWYYSGCEGVDSSAKRAASADKLNFRTGQKYPHTRENKRSPTKFLWFLIFFLYIII